MLFMIHSQYTEDKRYAMTIREQMGNVSSEVWRALRAKASNNISRMNTAVDAVLELLVATRSDPKNQSKRREIARSREIFLDYITDTNEYNETAERIDKYFTEYALVARAMK